MYNVYMTKNETKVYDFIKNYISKEGYSPAFSEIQEHFGFASIGSVQNYVKQLTKKGMVSQAPHQKRSLKIVEPTDPLMDPSKWTKEVVSLPILGSVAAGIPLERKSFDEFIDVPLHMAPKPDESFVLRVSGDSMIGAGIFNKDLLLIETCNYAENGSVIVASTEDDAATVKYFYKKPENNIIELRPANETMSSQYYKSHEISIRGKVVGLIRSYLF